MIFPGSDGLPRHPSQIYEAALEGLAVFVVLSGRRAFGALRRPGLLAGGFGVLYGAARIFCEFFREPDPRLEDLGNGLTMGMLLSRAADRRRPRPDLLVAAQRRRSATMSALGDAIKALVTNSGPITVERYMELALADPEYGYYMTRDPFGADGRFHHRAGNLADVRRVDRPVGGRDLDLDGTRPIQCA